MTTRPRFKATWLMAAAGAAALAACGSKDAGPTATYSREQLMDPETCKECHAEHYKEWSGSMHAYAATDPVFVAMNARGQRETKGALGSFCVNCHAPLAVQEHAADGSTDLSTLPKKLQGITCYFCHQVEDVQGTHNNPLVLANDTTMRGGIPDPVPNPAHTGQYSKLHDGTLVDNSKMCGACHDIVVPGHFSGAAEDVHLERTYEEWQGSLFASDKESHGHTVACASSGCHMPIEANVPVAARAGLTVPTRPARHKHLFAGVDLALVDSFPERAAQREAVSALLEPTLAMKLCVDILGNAQVTVENLGAAHAVPSGASQDRRMWVELTAFGGPSGDQIFSSGEVPDGTNVTDLNDPLLWLFRDVTLDKEGKPAHMFWDVASIDSSTQAQKPIPAPETLDINSVAPGRVYHIELVGPRTYRLYEPVKKLMPQRVELRFRVQPVGRDVLDDLVKSGDLTPDLRDAMTTIDLIPNRGDGGVTTTLTWTQAVARATGTTEGNATCVQTQPLR